MRKLALGACLLLGGCATTGDIVENSPPKPIDHLFYPPKAEIYADLPKNKFCEHIGEDFDHWIGVVLKNVEKLSVKEKEAIRIIIENLRSQTHQCGANFFGGYDFSSL